MFRVMKRDKKGTKRKALQCSKLSRGRSSTTQDTKETQRHTETGTERERAVAIALGGKRAAARVGGKHENSPLSGARVFWVKGNMVEAKTALNFTVDFSRAERNSTRQN